MADPKKNFQDLRELADSLRSLGQPVTLEALAQAVEEQDHE